MHGWHCYIFKTYPPDKLSKLRTTGPSGLLLNDTHTDGGQIMSADLLFFFFHAPKSFNKPFAFLLYKTSI